MNKSDLKSKLKTTMVLFGGIIILLWILFYLHTSHSLEENNEKIVHQVSEQVISALQKNFLELEQMAFVLSESKQVKEFVKEQDILQYYEKSNDVSKLLHTMVKPSVFKENLIIFNKDNVFCRFIGELGNTSAKRITYSINKRSLPQHLSMVLEGVNYIGYASPIYEKSDQIGVIVILMSEDRLLTLFEEYDNLNNLIIGLSADGKVISTNNDMLKGLEIAEVEENYPSIPNRKIGLTPFSIFVANDGSFITSSRNDFTKTVFIVAILFTVFILTFVFFWKRFFITPLIKIMHGVEKLGCGNEDEMLEYTGEVNFDRLVEHINTMFSHLSEKNKALLDMQYQLQNAEIEKQQSIIISLKKQINAHFTVNVLNIIKLLAEKHEMEKTSEMCDGLAYLLRYANSGNEFINGLEEFFIIEKYIAIMSIRYKNKFFVDFDIDDGLQDIKIPRMLVQPIIENAIVHGFSNMESGGVLKITAVLQDEKVIILVSDNGCGMNEDNLITLRKKISDAKNQKWGEQGLEHIALPNIQKRIFSYYGDSCGLLVDSTLGKGTTVKLSFPITYL